MSNQTSQPSVSIILPTYNGEEDLAQLLPRLAEQDYDGDVQICAIDSSSRDGSVELLKQAGAEVEVIPTSEFAHGKTRNRCSKRARGDYLVFVSQDVLPGDEHFLSGLTSAFEDPRVAGSYARVLPHADDDPLAARTVLDLPEASDESRVNDLDHVRGLWELDPDDRVSYLRFNNVASAIRREVFEEFPFPDTAFGEDFAWASRVLSRGWRLAYTPSAYVYHAHSYGVRSAYERYRVDADFHRQAHGWLVRPSAISALRGFVYEVRRDLAFVVKHSRPGRARAVLRSPLLRAAQVAGQYVGSHGWQSTELVQHALLEAAHAGD